MRSKNTFYEHEDGYMVGVTQQGIEFIFDKEDYGLVSQYTWTCNPVKYNQYIYTGTGSTRDKHICILLARLLMHAPDGLYVDHIMHDDMDYRKYNLRLCTKSQDLGNQRMRSNNTSGYKRVGWNKQARKWRAQIVINYMYKNLGYYDNIII